MIVDVFARPTVFSFADTLSADLGLGEEAVPSPLAVSYRVGASVPRGDAMGTAVVIWSRSLVVGQALPELPLALDGEAVVIDLEATYREAARRVYLA